MKPVKIVYRFDEEGYFKGEARAYKHPELDKWLIPLNCVETAPDSEKLKTHFAKLVDGAWTYESIPTSPEDFIGKQVSHKSQTKHNQLLRSLLQELVNKDSSHYRVIRGSEEEGLWWSVEKIPEKTEEEKAIEQKTAQVCLLKSKLRETDYVAIKIAEGVVDEEDSERYSDLIEQRKAWRKQINDLNSEISVLNNSEGV